jgi:cyanuric acid amidohydrolase
MVGNGCVNDFSRTLSSHVWESLIPSSAITVFSGGTEGVLTPHVTFIVQNPHSTGLYASVGRTRALQPHEVGTAEHARQVALTIKQMLKEPRAQQEFQDEKDVQLVLVKCPLLTSAKIAAIKAQGLQPITEDTYESMAKSRYATAVGVSCGLDEIRDEDLAKVMADKSTKAYSCRASCSSGAELEDCHILILASSLDTEPDRSRGPQLRAVSGKMIDAIDANAIMVMLDEVKRENGKVVQVFVKAEADPSGTIRGMRHTMNTDSDIHSTRHARAAVGGLVAGLVQDTAIYVSGGAEGQGPDGGGSLCMVYSI